MIFEAVQAVHPGSLMGKRNFSEADERDLGALGHQTRDQFARVRPHSAEGVSRYQYAHRTPGMRGLGATLFLLGSSLGARDAAREGFSWPHAQLDSDSLLTGSREVIIAGLCAPAPPHDFTQNIQTKGLNCKILQNKDLSAREHLKTSLGQLRGPAWFGERTHSCPNSILYYRPGWIFASVMPITDGL